MAQKRRRSPVPRKQRSWTVARMLLIIGYGIVFAVLGSIFFMRQELQRIGIFGDKPTVQAPVPRPQVKTEPQRPALVPPPQVTTESSRPVPTAPPRVTAESQRPESTSPPQVRPAPSPSGEISAEEKQALDDILRSKR